jgi:hypothetical protein
LQKKPSVNNFFSNFKPYGNLKHEKSNDGAGSMIAFDLQCRNGHVFEGWFADNRAYDCQAAQGLIACPVCEDTHIAKLPSGFAIKGSPHRPAEPPAAVNLRRIGRRLAEFVEKHFDDVGADFAKEALKMHYGVSEPRNIRGVSTLQEEKILKAEGIEYFKFPSPSSSDTDSN